MSDQASYLFSTRTSKALAEKIAKFYGQELGKINFQEFSDGEFEPVLDQSVRGGRVFLIGSTFPPADNLLELLLMIDAAKRASAKSVTVVLPYYGLARQDRKDQPRAPIGAKLVANLLTAAGATRIMTMDLHADQIQGFFEIPVDHLYASTIFIDYIQQLNLENLTIASPDMGGAKRAKNYAGHLGADVVIAYKERKKANQVDEMFLIGDVEGRNVRRRHLCPADWYPGSAPARLAGSARNHPVRRGSRGRAWPLSRRFPAHVGCSSGPKPRPDR